jgi:hypothetical protein
MRPGGPSWGKWRIPKGKGREGFIVMFRALKVVARLCQLRTDHLSPVSKFDYVLAHIRFMGSSKLSSFEGHWIGWHNTTPSLMYTRIMYGPPIDAQGIAWKTCTRVRWTWLDSLIVIMNCCHSWGLRDLACVVLSDCYLARFKLARVFMTLSYMSDTCLLLSFSSNSTFIMLHLYMRWMLTTY